MKGEKSSLLLIRESEANRIMITMDSVRSETSMRSARFIRTILALLIAFVFSSFNVCHASMGHFSKDEWSVNFTAALMAMEKGSYEEATKDLLKCLNHAGRDVGRALATMDAMERVFERTNNFDAKEAVLLSHAKVLNAYFEPCELQADVYLQLGELYSTAEKFPKSEKYFLLALPIIRKCDGPYCIPVGTTLNNLGYAELRQKRFAKAESYFKQSLEVFSRTSGTNSVFYGLTANNLGDLFEKTNRAKEALPYYEKAEHALINALGPDHPMSLDAATCAKSLRQKLGLEKKKPVRPESPIERKNLGPRDSKPGLPGPPFRFPDVALWPIRTT